MRWRVRYSTLRIPPDIPGSAFYSFSGTLFFIVFWEIHKQCEGQDPVFRIIEQTELHHFSFAAGDIDQADLTRVFFLIGFRRGIQHADLKSGIFRCDIAESEIGPGIPVGILQQNSCGDAMIIPPRTDLYQAAGYTMIFSV